MNNPRVGDNQRSNPSPGRIRGEFEICWGKRRRVPRDALALSLRYLVSSESFDEALSKKEIPPRVTRENAITTLRPIFKRRLYISCKMDPAKIMFRCDRRMQCSARTTSPHETGGYSTILRRWDYLRKKCTRITWDRSFFRCYYLSPHFPRFFLSFFFSYFFLISFFSFFLERIQRSYRLAVTIRDTAYARNELFDRCSVTV